MLQKEEDDASLGCADIGSDTIALCENLFKNLIDDAGLATTNSQKLPLWVLRRKRSDKQSYKISKRVLERLLLRHAILRRMEKVESRYDASANYISSAEENTSIVGGGLGESSTNGAIKSKEKSNSIFRFCANSRRAEEGLPSYRSSNSEKHERAYRLAVTDLFVEKAIAYLEVDYGTYIRNGKALFTLGFFTIIIGIVLSFVSTFTDLSISLLKSAGHEGLADSLSEVNKMAASKETWQEFASLFVRTFTLFGFLVIFTVYCWRLGKAMMDQAERLRERRHSLRQGRLFIHLNNGKVSAEELEKAFDWNVSKGNAFANIPTETSAPWGSVIKDAIKAIPEIFKRTKSSANE